MAHGCIIDLYIHIYIHGWPNYSRLSSIIMWPHVCSAMSVLQCLTLHKKWSFPLRISLVNVNKSSFLCALLFIGTAWKVSEYGVFSSPYFPVFELNTGKYRPKITPHLDTFHAMRALQESIIWYERKSIIFGWY